MIIALALLAVGFFLLVKGADYLITGSVSIARRFGIPNLLVGLTIVAFGTSAPELVVNIASVISGETDIAVGNIIGSNIANIALILGLSAVIFPLIVEREVIWKEIPRAFLAASLMFVMANDVLLDGQPRNILGRSDGAVLLLLFAMYLYYVFGIARNGSKGRLSALVKKEGMPEDLRDTMPLRKSALLAAGGVIALAVGGTFAVDGASSLAVMLGVPARVVGLTIVAVGTSLPELVTSVMAAVRKQADIAVGNIVGSNVFNVYMILGLSAVLRPLPFPTAAITDAVVVLGVTAVLFVFLFIGKRHELERWQGAAFIAFYALYVYHTVASG